MTSYLKQSTAIEIKVGPFLDETDGKTAETGLTIAQADVRLAKNAGDWAQKAETTTLVHEEAGWYRCLLDTTDTNTLGILIVAIHESGALPVWKEYMVRAANVYDSLVGGGDVLDVSVTQWLGTAAATPTVAGVPEVDLTHVVGTTTDVATLATSVGTLLTGIGGVATAAADGDPTSSDALFAYVKQILNVLMGSAGIVSWPASAAPGNAISMAEAIRQIYDNLVIVDDLLDTEIPALTTAVADLPTNAELATALGTADDAVLAAIATVDDFLDTEIAAIKAVTDQFVAAQAEPTGIPAANETPLEKIGFLFEALRNKLTTSATKKTFFDDAGVAQWEKDLSDDGTTYTETEGNAI